MPDISDMAAKEKVITFKDSKGKVVEAFKVSDFPVGELTDIVALRKLHPVRVPSNNTTYEFMRGQLHPEHIDEILSKSTSVTITASVAVGGVDK